MEGLETGQNPATCSSLNRNGLNDPPDRLASPRFFDFKPELVGSLDEDARDPGEIF
jgi:hypothetical protein